jgi:oligosaccharide repeat unit polymerase
MSIIITAFVGIISIILGKHIFKKWYNPLSLYSLIWSFVIIIYEIRLIPFGDLRTETWFVIVIAYLSFLFGILTIYFGKSLKIFEPKIIQSEIIIFHDNAHLIKFIIIFFSIIGIFSAIQHWTILIREFGSVLGVLLNATKYYRMRVAGEIEGVIPYIFISSYIAIFFSAIYTAYKKKLTILSVLPIFAVVFKETANLGRAGILFALVEFLTVFILARYILKETTSKIKIKRWKIIVASLVVLSITIGGATLIKSIRNPIENIKGTSPALKSFEGNLFLSPSIYLYMCSHLGILNKYLEHNDEENMIGAHTFLPIYNVISMTGAVEHPPFFQKGYFIPLWTNTGTYLRELDADFGKIGILVGPFLIGLFITFFWFRFFETKSLTYLILLTYFFLIVSFSFFVMISRLSSWFISLTALLILVPILESKIKKELNVRKKISSLHQKK